MGFSPDGKRIVSGGDDSTVRVWDAETGQETLTLKGHTGTVGHVSFSPDGRRIVSGGDDGRVKIWDARPSTVEPRVARLADLLDPHATPIIVQSTGTEDDSHSTVKNSLREDVEEPTKDQLEKHVPRSFRFDYQYEPKPGERRWRRVDDQTLIETYPDGEETKFQILGRTQVDDTTGIVAERLPDRSLQTFIPDKDSSHMWLRFRSPSNSKHWKYLGEMTKVE